MVTVEQRAAGAAARAEGEMAALGARYTAVLDEAIALRDAMQSEQDPLLRQSLDRQALLATDRVQLAPPRSSWKPPRSRPPETPPSTT